MTVEIGKADFQFVPRSAGFIKTSADGLPGPPVIVYNHRCDNDANLVQSRYLIQATEMRCHGLSPP